MSAERGGELPVFYAPAALQDLDAIWDWNENAYGRKRASHYVDFLLRHIEALGRRHPQGRAVESRPEFRYILICRRAKKHGHVAVYRCDGSAVHVFHVFHTSQDWQTMLADEKPGQ